MERCQLCNITDTNDAYRICSECRNKAAAGWAGYRAWIDRLENPPQEATTVDGEPSDAEFAKAMWGQVKVTR